MNGMGPTPTGSSPFDFAPDERLLVYGSLAPGAPNHHLLSGIPGFWLEAAVRGKLQQRGWAADGGYPAILLDDGGDPIPAYLFCSRELPALWPMLDDFEGDDYRRVLVEAEIAGGAVAAFIYEIAG